MKRKISNLLAGLGLCASMVMFSGQEAKATKNTGPENECEWNGCDCQCATMGCVCDMNSQL